MRKPKNYYITDLVLTLLTLTLILKYSKKTNHMQFTLNVTRCDLQYLFIRVRVKKR